MMTIEQKLVVGLDDIAAVVFECNHCHVRISLNPDNIGVLKGSCPRCLYVWEFLEPASALPAPNLSKSYFTDFTEALGKIRRMDPQTVGFSLLLEFKEPE
jgi:hypothetical protein